MMSGTRADHESRLNEERRRAERGKHLVVLMLNHLLQMGYTGSVDALQLESGLLLSQYEVADNVDLVSVLQEWEDYYEMRFQRRAKVVKKLSAYSDRVDPHGAKVRTPRPPCTSGSPSPPPQPLAVPVRLSHPGTHPPCTAAALASAPQRPARPDPLRALGGHSRRRSARAAAARAPASHLSNVTARPQPSTTTTTVRRTTPPLPAPGPVRLASAGSPSLKGATPARRPSVRWRRWVRPAGPGAPARRALRHTAAGAPRQRQDRLAGRGMLWVQTPCAPTASL